MKNKKMNKRILAVLLTLVTLLSFMPALAGATDNGNSNPTGYYYNQLPTITEARDIYNVIARMYESGKMAEGTYTVDLVAEGALSNQSYDQNVLMADFIAARDAFALDNSGIVYLETDNLTITQTQDKDGNYVITLGIGRYDNYFADGFTAENALSAQKAYDEKIESIADEAKKGEYLDDKVKAAFNGVMELTKYALESDAKPENVPYVRNPYGSIVKGEAVCEGYARALKSVLDSVGIDNILVQGTYYNEGNFEPHMWNYVKMDDNQWYLLDSTMQDAIGGDTEYFLVTASSEIFKNYNPDGKISLSEKAIEFNYPELSSDAYERLSTMFTKVGTDESGFNNISYMGKGFFETQNDGKYIIGSWDNTNWYYFERHRAYMEEAASNYDYAGFDKDYGTYFTDVSHFAYFAITYTAPSNDYTGTTDPSFYTYYGEDKYDLSKVDEIQEYKKAAPVAVTREPANSRLEGGKTYNAKVVFSEKLTLANPEVPAGIAWTNEIEGATISDFEWNGDRTITFKFTTVNSYRFTTSYSFTVTGLMGKESLLAPRAFGYSIVNNPVFGCPKIPNSVTTAYANTPALIADENLAETVWTDGENEVPYKLALVASEITGNDKDDMVNSIPGDVKASKTYEISLGLCSVQLDYVANKRVKVFVPFPDGYNAESGVTFKAYHFDKNGKPEEIDCVTTEHGIIMMCNSFSPFAVVAVEAVSGADKAVMTVANGNGDVFFNGNSTDMVKVADGATETVTVVPDEGYIIDSITLNGKAVEYTAGNADNTADVAFSYDALKANGSVLEVTFVKGEIIVSELPDASTPDEPTTPDTTKPVEPDTTKPTEPDTTKPVEPDTTKPVEPDTTKPTEPVESEKPAKKNLFERLMDFFKMIFEILKGFFE